MKYCINITLIQPSFIYSSLRNAPLVYSDKTGD